MWEVVSLSAVKRIDVITIDRLLCEGEIKERPVGWGICLLWEGSPLVVGGLHQRWDEEWSGVVCRSKG